MSSHLDRFYALMAALHDRVGGPRRLEQCSGRTGWPRRGVYFFFENGEARADGSPRVVRVGTHALRTNSRTTLWGRLSQHRGTDAGRHPGGGNHRGSIFRLHVGTALLRRDGDADGVASTWGIGGSAPSEVKARECSHERRVSDHIRAMPFLWVEIPDDAAPASDRGLVETGAIALLSRRSNVGADAATDVWLGRHSARPAIVECGLWNVNHVERPEPAGWLDVLERHIEGHPRHA